MYSAGYGTHPYASCPELFSNSRKAGWGFLPCAPGSSGDEPLQSGGCGLSLLLVAEHFKIHFSFIEKCYRGTWLKKIKHYKKVYNERYMFPSSLDLRSFFPEIIYACSWPKLFPSLSISAGRASIPYSSGSLVNFIFFSPSYFYFLAILDFILGVLSFVFSISVFQGLSPS